MIRQGTFKDKLQILSLIKEFKDTKAEMVKFDINKVSDITNKCIELGTVLVLDEGMQIRGATVGMLFHSLMSYELIYQDLFFYIQKSYLGHTKSILSALENRCKELNVGRISMATMGDNPRLDRLYELLGYSILEKHFSKELMHEKTNA